MGRAAPALPLHPPGKVNVLSTLWHNRQAKGGDLTHTLRRNGGSLDEPNRGLRCMCEMGTFSQRRGNSNTSGILHMERTQPPTDDVELMLRVKEGDCASFALLLERHRLSVERFLYSKVRNRALAEELAQEVFLRVYRARGGYQPTARFKAWLFQIAAHLGSNSRRDRRREILHDPLDIQAPHGPALQLPDRRPTIEQELVGDVKLA